MSHNIEESNLKSKHNSLTDHSEKFVLYTNIIIGLSFLLILSLLASLFLQDILGVLSQYMILPLGIIGIIIIFLILASKTRVPINDRLFFQFYGITRRLSDFIEDGSNGNKDSCLKRIKTVSMYTGAWNSTFAPPVISDLPQSLSKNLLKLSKLINSIEVDTYKIKNKEENDLKIKNLKIFFEHLHDFSFLIYQRQPTHEELSKFDQTFEKIKLETKQKTPFYEVLELFFTSHPRMRFGLSPASGLLFFAIFNLMEPTKFYESAQGGVYVAIMALPVIFMWMRRNS